MELAMRVRVEKWDNSAAVRIPGPIVKEAALSLGQTVELRTEGDRIVIEPVWPQEYDLDRLLAGIADENRHKAVDEGP